jgi:hypothetical protein
VQSKALITADGHRPSAHSIDHPDWQDVTPTGDPLPDGGGLGGLGGLGGGGSGGSGGSTGTTLPGGLTIPTLPPGMTLPPGVSLPGGGG